MNNKIIFYIITYLTTFLFVKNALLAQTNVSMNGVTFEQLEFFNQKDEAFTFFNKFFYPKDKQSFLNMFYKNEAIPISNEDYNTWQKNISKAKLTYKGYYKFISKYEAVPETIVIITFINTYDNLIKRSYLRAKIIDNKYYIKNMFSDENIERACYTLSLLKPENLKSKSTFNNISPEYGNHSEFFDFVKYQPKEAENIKASKALTKEYINKLQISEEQKNNLIQKLEMDKPQELVFSLSEILKISEFQIIKELEKVSGYNILTPVAKESETH